MFNVASAAPTLAGATTTWAFNISNTVGPWLGGLVIGAGWGYPAVAWTAAALAALAVGTTAVASRLHRRSTATESGTRVVASSADSAPKAAAPAKTETTTAAGPCSTT